jgi:hypothetical protein
VIVTSAALGGREGTWDVHIENASFGSIVAGAADSDTRGGGSDADRFDAAGRLVVEPFGDGHAHLDWPTTVGRPGVQSSRGPCSRPSRCGPNARKRVSLTLTRSTGTPWRRPDRSSQWHPIEIQIVAFPQNTVLSFRDGMAYYEFERLTRWGHRTWCASPMPSWRIAHNERPHEASAPFPSPAAAIGLHQFEDGGPDARKRLVAAFAKSVADVCDRLAAGTSRLAADHPGPTAEATAECFRPMGQVVEGSS